MAGRPRLVDDVTLLRATVTIMGRTGPSALTLALVATEAGVTPATVVQRFGNKRGLMLALAHSHAERASERHLHSRDQGSHPLQALTDLVVGTWDPATTPQVFANHLAFLCADLVDEDLRALTLATQRSQERTVRNLLDSAVAAGELAPGTDTAALTASIQSAVAGSGLLWAMDRQGTLNARLRSALDLALSSHLTKPPTPNPKETP
ncbi:TetR/AcrR family transcriptional regulator [Galactobacter caseinivorans]|uniref:TetR/AcrR family transcriptional regulator n=1 Tax=Galactobacter caseinivorans TaxID=2676123 RepID=A0A496PL99_9MICC|nr:TetR/AcrR family transcriptional regulator [Galactobacter caseinivorans]RKW71328.1 TetR/AcrR family transcriptional regulator [Galactobacter caseinivorans]